jgi:hypothetical protein
MSTRTQRDPRKPRLGDAIHFAQTRRACYAGLITATGVAIEYSDEELAEMSEKTREQVALDHSYDQINLSYFVPNQKGSELAMQVDRSSEKPYGGTWHFPEECVYER